MPRPSPTWHHGTLRTNLIDAFFPSQRRQLEQILHRKAQRKEGIQLSFRTRAIKDYDLWDRNTSHSPRSGPFWNVASGAWETRSESFSMTAAHIVPQMLGKSLMKKVFGDHHHFYDLYGSKNALLLPSGIACALDEWAITVVPDIPENPILPDRRAWVASDIKEYKFRVLNPSHENLQERISTRPEDNRLGKDLDQQRLIFRETSNFRPSVKYLYFWHRCAVMNKFYPQFYDDTPVEYLKDMSRAKREMWLSRKAFSEASGLRSKIEFWQNVVHDLRRINDDPDFLLDWSMELKT